MARTPKSRVDVQWPEGGLDESGAYRKQSPYFTPSALNVRPTGTIESRLRGGSRPGIDKAFYEQIAGTYPVRHLGTLAIVDSSGWNVYSDNFAGATLGGDWTAATWCSAAPGILPGSLAAVSTTYQNLGATLATQSVDTSSRYEIGLFIRPYAGAWCGHYRLYARMNATTPVATTDGVIADLVMEDSTGTFSGTLTRYNAGAPTVTAFTATASPITPQAAWFTLLVNGNNVTVKWAGNTLISAQDVSGDLGAGAAHGVGFGLEATTASGICIADSWRFVYYSSNEVDRPRELVMAVANGALYYESITGMAAVSTSLTLNSAVKLEAVDLLQKYYIADHAAPEASGTNGVTSSTSLDSASYTDWTATNINANDYVAVLSGGTGSLTAGTYAIATVAAGSITLSSAPGDATGVTFSIQRAPKIYDHSAGTLTVLAAASGKGQVPCGCPYIAVYRGRLCLAGEHVCYQSRVDDPTDWDYSQTDAEGAVATTGSDSARGQIGDIFTALIPVSEDYLVYGCRQSIWLQRGDIHPAVGGEISNVVHGTGILPHGWCHVPGGGVAFLSWDGLYVYFPSSGKEPENISQERLPEQLRDISTDMYTITMVYDPRYDGILIILTAGTSDDRNSWFFDWNTKSFWPENCPAADEAFSAVGYHGDLLPASTVLLGARNGYLKMHNDHFETDGGTEISSHCTFGPFKPGGMFYEGRLDEMVAVLAQDSGDVDWAVRVADSTQEAVDSSTDFATGTWSAGRNSRVMPRARGGGLVIRLSNNTTRKWALDGLSAAFTKVGVQRV